MPKKLKPSSTKHKTRFCNLQEFLKNILTQHTFINKKNINLSVSKHFSYFYIVLAHRKDVTTEGKHDIYSH